MSGDSRYFAELTSPEVEALLSADARPVLLLPVGSVEAHGPHLPLGTDTLISLGMSTRVSETFADPVDLRILPTVPYAVTRYAGRFKGTIHIEESTLRALLVELCESLISQGFRYIVIVNNHFEPEHVRTLHGAIDEIARRTGSIPGFLDLTRRYRAERLSREFRELGSHAGQYETSLILAERDDLVKVDLLPRLAPNRVNLGAMTGGAGIADFERMGLPLAYNGSPADATPTEGEQSFETLVAMLGEVILDLVRGDGGRDLPGRFARAAADGATNEPPSAA
ncbi:MAG: creatininase family protein [Thermoleophilaceae bacterium]